MKATVKATEKVTKKAKDPEKVTDLRAIKYDADGQVYYKLQFCDDWDLLPQRGAHGVDACTFDELDQLHSRRLKIKKTKFDDLQASKHILSDDYHQFYDNLPYE
ncbi:hypothetical protein JTB14_018307 [Gonioctena quinquepunctata]|nr:hypothetical protein JTB14_018307 [Gonioctena quinquepunctata]